MGFRAGIFPLIFSPYIKGMRGTTFPIFPNLWSFKEAVQGASLSSFVSVVWFLCSSQSSFFSFLSFITFLSEMGRFLSLVDTPEKRQAFKAKYNIPTRVEIEHCHLGEWHTKRPKGAMVIPMIVTTRKSSSCGGPIAAGAKTAAIGRPIAARTGPAAVQEIYCGALQWRAIGPP